MRDILSFEYFLRWNLRSFLLFAFLFFICWTMRNLHGCARSINIHQLSLSSSSLRFFSFHLLPWLLNLSLPPHRSSAPFPLLPWNRISAPGLRLPPLPSLTTLTSSFLALQPPNSSISAATPFFAPMATGPTLAHGCINGVDDDFRDPALGESAPPKVLIRQPDALQKKKDAIRSAGVRKLQVIADFDMTLTKYMVNGKRGESSHGIIQTENEEINRKRKKLSEEYYPHEIDPSLTYEKKFVLMEEWWGKSHALILEGGLTFDKIKHSVADANIELRKNCFELFELLNEHEVPVMIFSAGLADVIEEVLRQKLHKTFSNIRVVSNRMQFDDGGNLIGFKGKVIHVLNKNEHALELAAPMHGDDGRLIVEEKEGSCEKSILQRQNVVLLGDHLGDLKMSDGVDYENRITVGFLNNNVEKLRDVYMEKFDIVVLDDGPMSVVVDLINEITSN